MPRASARRAVSIWTSSARAGRFKQLQMGLRRFHFGGEARDERPLIVALLLRYGFAGKQAFDPLPG